MNEEQNGNGQTTAIEQRRERAPIMAGQRGLELRTMDEMWRFAGAVATSKFKPKGMEAQEDIFVALQFGAEIGLSPMQSLQSLAVVNGRPAIYGDAAMAMVRASGELEAYSQRMEGAGDARCAVVIIKRKGQDPIEGRFSVADAKRAGLWDRKNQDGSPGMYMKYPDRMLTFRARGWPLRDAFADILRGLKTSEEIADYIDVDAQPVRPNTYTGTERHAPRLAASPAVVEADAVAAGEAAVRPDTDAMRRTRNTTRQRLEAEAVALGIAVFRTDTSVTLADKIRDARLRTPPQEQTAPDDPTPATGQAEPDTGTEEKETKGNAFLE